MDTAHPWAPPRTGRIGPNAVLQLVPVLQDRLGPVETLALMARAGVEMPDDGGLMAEAPAHRLHAALRRNHPAQAPEILALAGRRTADYILAHRIPKPAQWALRAMPAPLAARALSRAIERHAWTFAGLGRFSRQGGDFLLQDNPLIRNENAKAPLCHWHAAVFQRLFQVLVSPRARAVETACCACGDAACRFHIVMDQSRG